MSGRSRLLSARALASVIQVVFVVSLVPLSTNAMTLFQAVAKKVKQIDPGKAPPPEESLYELGLPHHSQPMATVIIKPTIQTRPPVPGAVRDVPDIDKYEAAQPLGVRKKSSMPLVIAAIVGTSITVVAISVYYYFYKRNQRNPENIEKPKAKNTVKKHGKSGKKVKRHGETKGKSKSGKGHEHKKSKHRSDELMPERSKALPEENRGLISE